MLIWFIVGTLVVSIIAFMYSRNHRETEPFNLIKGLADKGSVRGQIDLAMMYYNGTNVRQDFTKAIEWAQKAANQGNSEALFVLGIMYTQKNDTKAFEYYLQAAKQGNMNAQHMLGLIYKEGRSVNQDYIKAFEWMQKAANQGHARAQYELNLMREKGTDIQQDYKPT